MRPKPTNRTGMGSAAFWLVVQFIAMETKETSVDTRPPWPGFSSVRRAWVRGREARSSNPAPTLLPPTARTETRGKKEGTRVPLSWACEHSLTYLPACSHSFAPFFLLWTQERSGPPGEPCLSIVRSVGRSSDGRAGLASHDAAAAPSEHTPSSGVRTDRSRASI